MGTFRVGLLRAALLWLRQKSLPLVSGKRAFPLLRTALFDDFVRYIGRNFLVAEELHGASGTTLRH